MNTTEHSRLTHDILGFLSATDTIGMARDIADEIIADMSEANRSLDSITIGELRAAVAQYRAERASVEQAQAEPDVAQREQVAISGVTYDVMSSTTPEQAEEAGRVNTARHMIANKNARHLDLKRPTGRKGFFAVQFENGTYSTVADMGYVW